MTGIITILQSDSASVLTDGAMFDANGGVEFIGPKVFALPHVNAALALRGPYHGLTALAGYLSKAASFDSLRDTIVDDLRTAVTGLESAFQASVHDYPAEMPWQATVVGLSETTGFDAYSVMSVDNGSGMPWTVLTSPTYYTISPFKAESEIHKVAWEVFGGRSADEIDPRVDGLRVMEAQRRTKLPHPSNKIEISGVGGFAQLTTVRRDGIHTEILKRWPDVVGQPIQPSEAA